MTSPMNHPDEFSRLLGDVHPSVRPPGKFAEALLSDIQQAFDSSVAAQRASFRIRRRWLWLSMASAACLAIGIMAVVLHGHGHPQPPAPAASLAQAPANIFPARLADDIQLTSTFGSNTLDRPIKAWLSPGNTQPAYAFSPIGNVDGWDADRLRKSGITVILAKSGFQSEDPPLEWVRVSFDSSHLPKDQPVAMTARIVSETRTVATLRAERDEQTKDSVTLAFSVQAEYQPQSSLDICIWTDTPGGGRAAHGYTLSMRRIIELAHQVGRSPRVSAPAGDLAQAPATSTANTQGMTLGMLSQEQQVGRASLVVRTRLVEWNHGLIRHDVLRVIYGDPGDGSLLMDCSAEIKALGAGLRAATAKEFGHEPTPAELENSAMREIGMEKGKEMILYLTPGPVRPGQQPVYHGGSAFDVPPNHRLDDLEDAIVRIIADGGYLAPSFPQPADILEEHVLAAELVVRAQLTQVTDADSRWTILNAIKGKPQRKTLIVPHDLFRLRAQTIVQHRLATARPATQQEIAAEMKRLIDAELLPDRKAILFLGQAKLEGDNLRAPLRQRIFEDAAGQRLNEADRAIRAVQTHQLPKNL